MSLVLIGECPSERIQGLLPTGLTLTGSTGRNLCSYAGWDWLDYLRHTMRFNLFGEYQPRWSAELARQRAQVLEEALGGLSVLLLGSKVREAFGLAGEPMFEWLHLDWANVALIPHPSGRSRVWNDPGARATAREFLGPLLS